MNQWTMKVLGPDGPLHFSAFHPDYKMPATPPATLVRARDVALKTGLHHVYTGHGQHQAGDTTLCSACHGPLIVRDWYEIKQYRLTPDGHCPDRGAAAAGRSAQEAGHFGRRRIPIAISMF